MTRPMAMPVGAQMGVTLGWIEAKRRLSVAARPSTDASRQRTPRLSTTSDRLSLRGLGARQSALEEQGAVGRTELGLERPVRVWHQPQHVPCFVDDAGDVAGRTVGVGHIAEHHLAFA